jgi:hypothetical protein
MVFFLPGCFSLGERDGKRPMKKVKQIDEYFYNSRQESPL